MDLALARADDAGFAARRSNSEGAGKRRGFGVASYIESVYALNDRMEIRFDPGGDVTIVSGTFSYGQGHRTVYAQMVSDWLGVPIENIDFIQGDTDRVAFGRGSFGSRSMVVGGSALHAAAEEVIARGRNIAAHLLEAAPEDVTFADGVYSVAGTDRQAALTDVAKQSYAIGAIPPELGVGLEGRGTFAPHEETYPNGCHVAEVEIDPETGKVDIIGYWVVDDFGLVLNPLLLEGQIHGGVAQGIGQALLEDIVFDRDSGQLLSASFLDYGMPRADDYAVLRCRDPQRSRNIQPARRQRCRGGRRGRGAARRRQRDIGRATAPRRLAHRDAGHAGARLAGDQGREAGLAARFPPFETHRLRRCSSGRTETREVAQPH